jgi:archaellum biogenesis protein FlaJ (TadC family)
MEEQSLLQDTPGTQVKPATPSNPPSNYLIGAILCTIFCCQVFGIISIIYAAQVNSKWEAGNFEGARQSSKNALLWIWLAIGSAVVIFVTALSFGIGMAFLSNVFHW